MTENLLTRKQLRDEWAKRITTAEKKYTDYYDLVAEIREYYRNERKKNKQNIFWSSVETLKPFLYFKQPKPFIIKSNKVANSAETLACKMLERALSWNMKQFDFDSIIKYARNDFLLSGMGILWEQYCPSFKSLADGYIKEAEQVNTVYVNPLNFLADTENVDVWEDVEWIARRVFIKLEDLSENFDNHIVDWFYKYSKQQNSITVYEIWDKKTRCIYYLSPEYTPDFLAINEDTLHLSGFFPMPKPIMATLTNDGIIPVPDYIEIKSLLSELDGVNNRMRLTMQAIKVSGCYDNSFPELANILDKDITLISLSDFDKLKEAGGIKGVIDFAPIEQYISALKILAERRQILVNSIYEVTGVSDIMRGVSKSGDTATAINSKTNFGTLRNQDRQNDMQRFLKDLLRIKAEIICEHFSADFLTSFLTEEEKKSQDVIIALQLLKEDKLRDMIIDLETDGCYNENLEENRILNILKNINEMISLSFNIVSKQPALLPLYRQMIECAVSTIPNARQFETVMETAFHKIETELNQPNKVIIPQNNQLIEIQKQKVSQDFAIKKEQNAIKREELELKKASELNKLIKHEQGEK